MSETVLKIRLSELLVARLICKRNNCGGVIEVPVHRLSAADGSRCPVCNGFFRNSIGGGGETFGDLGSAIAAASAAELGKIVELEFVLPVKEGKKA